MKAKELEELIRESVRKTITENSSGKSTVKRTGSGNKLNEAFELQSRVEQAVIAAVHCAKIITGSVQKPSGFIGSTLEKCFDDILKLFVSETGDLAVPDLNPDELRDSFFAQLDQQIVDPASKTANISKKILDKAVDKLNVYVGESMIAEMWNFPEEEDGNEHFFSVTLPNMASSVLIWAEKGQDFLKQKILQTANTHGVEPATFVDDLEKYVIRAWRRESPTNEYIPSERLSGHHGEALDTAQAVLDQLGGLRESATFYTIDSFHQLVREMIQEAVKEQMLGELKRLHLKELGGVIGSQESDGSQPTTGTSGTTEASGTKSGIQTQPGNNDVSNNVLVPGTNMNINQGLQAAAKDPNFKKKADMVKKISDQIAGMKGVVVK